MRRLFLVAVTIVGAIGVIGAGLGLEFRRDMQQQVARIAIGSTMVSTRCGQVEVAESGSGPPLLVVHGSGGGFDQGSTIGADYAARGWRVIAPSRFGYLRTPYPADPSPQAQADQFACLLDALGITDAAVMGVSAGAISALEFAVRHPQRTRALILIVPAVYRPDPTPPMPVWAERLLLAIVGADFPMWFVSRFAPDVARRLVLATPPSEYAAASDDEKRRADTVLAQILPISARKQGLLNDTRLATRAARADLEAVRAPTLVVSARDDGYGTYEAARYSAAHIRSARFIGFDRGGHALLGRQAEVVAAVESLLREAPRGRPTP